MIAAGDIQAVVRTTSDLPTTDVLAGIVDVGAWEGRAEKPGLFHFWRGGEALPMIKDKVANQSKANAVFKPTPAQVKGDATTRAARAIIDQETVARDAKTARLREARLARDAAQEAEAAAAPAPVKPKAKKARSTA